MNTKDICRILQDTVVGIYVFDGTERISAGSGFVFDPQGLVFTAGHVLHNTRPFTTEELRSASLSIWVKIKGRPPVRYGLGMPVLSIVSPDLGERLTIDLAMLAPLQPFEAPIPYLPTKPGAPTIGEDVLMAGYSDEIYMPFAIDARLRSSLVGFSEFQRARMNGYDVELGLLMVKSGIVGSCARYEFSGPAGLLRGATFFVDNGIHSGASGGPVVDSDCNAIGVITERAITALRDGPVPNLKVPSGSTYAMTVDPLLGYNQLSANSSGAPPPPV